MFHVPIEVIYGADNVVGLQAGRVSFVSDSKYAYGLPSFGSWSDKPHYASLGMLVQIDEEVFPRDTLRYISRSLVNFFPGSDLYFRQLFLLFD